MRGFVVGIGSDLGDGQALDHGELGAELWYDSVGFVAIPSADERGYFQRCIFEELALCVEEIMESWVVFARQGHNQRGIF